MASPNWGNLMKKVIKEIMTPPAFLPANPPSKIKSESSKQEHRSNTQESKKKIDKPVLLPVVSGQIQPANVRSSGTVKTVSESTGQIQTGSEQEQILRHYGIPADTLEMFQLKPYKLEPVGPIVRARTKTGVYALKKTALPPERIVFMDQALQYALKNEFAKAAAFVHTRKGQPYAKLGGSTFYCTQWVQGAECDFSSLAQVCAAAESLAQFHQATQNFKMNGYSTPKAFSFISQLRARQQDLRRFSRLARAAKKPTPVDNWVRENLAVYRAQAKRALTILEQAECKEQLEKDKQEPGLCHMDVTAHNLIYTSKHQIALVDFDLMAAGPRVLDIANLLRRSLQANNWEKDFAVSQLVTVNSVKSLTYEEYLLIQGLLTFPTRIWRILSSAYNEKAVSGTLDWLAMEDGQLEAKQAFLDLYARHVTHFS